MCQFVAEHNSTLLDRTKTCRIYTTTNLAQRNRDFIAIAIGMASILQCFPVAPLPFVMSSLAHGPQMTILRERE
jgi:hypothetical protein